uniref:LRRNT domain-containing protein n=1 Tax=Scophthalmus maximus TaxID=52904 RepID=A0A8D3APM2_SCOMX
MYYIFTYMLLLCVLTTNVGGCHCNPPAAALLLLLCLGFPTSVAVCPPYCLCASDIISCSGLNLSKLPSGLPSYATRLDLSHNALTALSTDWIPQQFHRLATLVLSRNSINQIEANAFNATPHLLHLDLSSNRITVLNVSLFTGLKELKELLLFDNQIVQINPGALDDLHSLQRLYLSGNKLKAFPLGLYWEPGGPRNLTFLDLSYNRLTKLPVQSLLSLTRQGRIYLQENPLVCDCALLALLEYWLWKQYRPLVDFRGEYPCREDSGPGPTCNQQGVSDMPLESQTYQEEPGKWLRVPCPGLGSSAQEDLVVFCTASAIGSVRRSGTEHFNTAFTTLASCVVSIVLVLLYLYLTPCRCRESRGGSRGCGGRAIILCSDPREVESGQQWSNGKRVAFLEPQAEDSNIGSPKTPAVNLDHSTIEGILKNGSRTVGQRIHT